MLGLLTMIALLGVAWAMSWWWTDWPTRAVLKTPGDTWPLAFSPDSRTFATSDRAGITLWEGDTGRKRTTWLLGSDSR